ncbi:microfibrillar-associated protein 2-like [Rhinatrema bivittatum]|uniref:microfibrillar-associated protein 2 n=1 Tax=Rhinatrema bivittatum TaxID=194408 RepID=UPI00112D21C3|nr:microfibrillar-associated protein 2 [Rhinatrema bivittatum]XP_029435041.1 microfibrillar-associated protein 2-like [Rhinatrema bivittatum]
MSARAVSLVLLSLPAAILAQYRWPSYPYPELGMHYDESTQYFYDYQEVTPNPIEQQQQGKYQYQPQQQQQILEQYLPDPTLDLPETEPTEPGPLDCREEQYPCTRLYSVHKPCKQCLNEICFYSLRRMYVINKEICVRTVCAHEELLRADLCRDKFSKCGVMASSGLCQSVASYCTKSCGGC